MASNRRLSVLIGCFGDYPEYSLRAVMSVLEGYTPATRPFDLHVGLNACCQETTLNLRVLHDRGQIDSLIETKRNINKCPMKRLLIERAETEFALWMDDDSHVAEDWYEHIEDFFSKHAELDVAGFLCSKGRNEKYQGFLRQRPWYRGEELWSDLSRQFAVFPTGGCYLFRVAFVRQHNYPDKAMVKRSDDLLLGDLVSQQGGCLIAFPPDLLERLHISDGERRGSGEGTTDFRHVDPVTGEFSAERVYHSDDDVALLSHAKALQDAGRLEEALRFYKRLTELHPKVAELHFNIALLLIELSRFNEATESFDRALRANPEYLEACNNKGNLLAELGRIEEAIELYQRAADINPKFVPAHNNLGNALLKIGRATEAVSAFRAALAVDRRLPEAHRNLSNALYRSGEINEALLHARLAVRYAPECAEAHFQLGLLWFKIGRLQEGVRELEWRFKLPKWPQSLKPSAKVSETNLMNTITVVQEGTDSEALYFLRFVALLSKQNIQIKFAGSTQVNSIARLIKGVTIIGELETYAPIPEAIPLFSVPNLLPEHILSESMGNIFRDSIIDNDQSLSEYHTSDLKVGVSWCASSSHGTIFKTAVALEEVTHLFKIPGITFFPIADQLGSVDRAKLALYPNLKILEGDYRDLSKLLSWINSLDLLITVDNQLALLASLLGKRCFVILREPSSWIWPDKGAPFSWFPLTELFRLQTDASPCFSQLIGRVKELSRRHHETLVSDTAPTEHSRF